ncbi:histidine phosphotransferase family protein [Amorphus orientalis]|uniref:Histidine phosphotransferase ChpT n=1 Tax=Amorphus orientalis TaxID=649198 RepID=A0AAE3VKX5_9HYPH|nr:histidine phosphotransferase family protein [Amorphus orientalis]MDQ0313936.1 histidine phosphotransferase ChpT [Amorphus orientalis]
MSSAQLSGAIELASLLASRICHDVVGPVGAIANGIEMLESDDSEENRELALQLMGRSARQASASLQLMRMAFGAGSSAGSVIDLNDAARLLREYFDFERADLELELPSAVAPRPVVRVLLNLVIFAVRAIPRGGVIRVRADLDGEAMAIAIEAEGPKARVPDVTPLVTGGDGDPTLDPHSIQPHLTGLLLQAAGMTAATDLDGERFTITAR